MRVLLGGVSHCFRYRYMLTSLKFLFYDTVPQSILMDFVRMNKKLRWIKCDLTPENVAVMKAERPEVTFVSSHLDM